MENNAIEASNESSHGLRELRDFTNFFSYSGRTVSECIGSNRASTAKQLAEKYPQARAFMENIKKHSNYIKTHGGGTNAKDYAFRIPHIQAMKELIEVSSRLQFIKALNDQLNVYKEENVGWGVLELDYEYKDGQLKKAWVTIDGKVIDLTKPTRIQAVDWYGRLIDGIELIDINCGKVKKVLRRGKQGEVLTDTQGNAIYDELQTPPNVVIRLADDSLSNQKYIDEALARDGAINKSDISKTFLFSAFNFLVVRVADDVVDEANDYFPTAYETPIFKELDYSHDIPFPDYADIAERFNQWKDIDLCYNTREFAGLNIFRWGIVDVDTWNRGVAIFKAVDNAPKIWGNDTPIYGKVVQRANQRIAELKTKTDANKIDIDNVVIAGASLSKIVNVMGQAYYKMRALVVDKVTDSDIEFRDTFITLRSKRERTSKYQTISRLNTDLYKVIECDKDGNFIRVINPIDIFALVNYDIGVTIVKFEAELITREGEIPGAVKSSEDHTAYYNAIGSFKG